MQMHHSRTQQDAQLLTFALQTTYAASEPAFYDDKIQTFAAVLDAPATLDERDQRLAYSLMQRQLAAIALLARSQDEVARAMVAEYKLVFDAPGGRAWLEAYPNSRFKKLVLEAFASIEREDARQASG